MKILIIRPAALGDTLMLVPALDRMRQFASLCVAGRMPGLEYLEAFADPCLDFEAAGWHTLFTSTPEVPALPGADLAIAFLQDPEGTVRQNLSALLPGAGVYLFPGLPSPGEGMHVALYLARCLHAAGACLDPDEAMREALRRPLLRPDGHAPRDGRIVLHPGSGGREKNHPPEFWLDLISRMRVEPSFRGRGLTVLLGPAEADLRPLFERRVRDGGDVILFAPEKRRLVSLLENADPYVGQDSGITHLAAMLGAPTLALFLSSSVLQWRPLGPRVRVILHPEPDLNLVSQVLTEVRSLTGTRDESRSRDR
ncbi:MAG: glycosyltransferase family 9 protein [Thermodesulfobacteriota bacterium]